MAHLAQLYSLWPRGVGASQKRGVSQKGRSLMLGVFLGGGGGVGTPSSTPSQVISGYFLPLRHVYIAVLRQLLQRKAIVGVMDIDLQWRDPGFSNGGRCFVANGGGGTSCFQVKSA